MQSHFVYFGLSSLELGLGGIVSFLLFRSKDRNTYWPIAILALWSAVPLLTLIWVRSLGPGTITPLRAYNLYFGVFWSFFFLQSVSGVLLTYNIFNAAMRPLKGLQSLGAIMYFWAATVSFTLAFTSAIEPPTSRLAPVTMLVDEFQRSASILTLSLVLFVCFAVRPMGLSARSRVVGAGLGLAIVSTLWLIDAKYIGTPRRLFDPAALYESSIRCVAECVWIYYFSRPEPKRKFVLLPTTSPFHKWNRISEMLGHEPGYVAIAGVPPEAFAEAEIEIFHRASAKMTAQERFNAAFKEEPPTLFSK